MDSLLDIISHEPAERARKAQPGRRQLRPEDVLDIVARRRAGATAISLAIEYDITAVMVSYILGGQRWAGVTGIKPKAKAEKPPNDRHASILLQQIAQQPDRAPVRRSKFDDKFGPGAAMKTVKRVMTAGAR